MRLRKSSSPRRGFTLTELLVVIGVIALLIGILLPSLSRAREASRRAVCLSNLRTLGQALVAYANAYGDKLPNLNSPQTWDDAAGQSTVLVNFATQYVRSPGVFHCPSDYDPIPTAIETADYFADNSARVSYEWFCLWWPPEYPPRITRFKGQAPLIWDHDGGDPINPTSPVTPHSSLRNHTRGDKTLGGNVAFSDGHAEWQDAANWDGQSWPHPADTFYPSVWPP